MLFSFTHDKILQATLIQSHLLLADLETLLTTVYFHELFWDLCCFLYKMQLMHRMPPLYSTLLDEGDSNRLLYVLFQYFY